jgi:DNA anti-recombination protein RmuC
MDMFMDKLAQKLSAQEIIKANTAADTEELKRLKNQVEEYNEYLDRLKQLIDESDARLKESADTGAVNRLADESIEKIRSMQKEYEGLEKMQEELAGKLDEINSSLTERLDKLEEKLDTDAPEPVAEKLDGLEENVHKECVKVYRNVQAVVVEESGKISTASENTQSRVKAVNSKVGVLIGISTAALLFSLVSMVLQILGVLNINIF